MDWVQIGSFVLAFLGLGGGSLLYYKANKRGKEIDNESKETENYIKVADVYKEYADNRNASAEKKQVKIDKLYGDLRAEQNAHIQTRKECAEKDITIERLKWYKCVRDCPKRAPRREELLGEMIESLEDEEIEEQNN